MLGEVEDPATVSAAASGGGGGPGPSETELSTSTLLLDSGHGVISCLELLLL